MPSTGVRRVALVSEAIILADPELTGLRATGVEIVKVPPADDESTQVASLDGCFGIVAGAEPYSRAVLEALPDLRIICRAGVGYDAIDLAAASELGIHVTVTAGVNALGVAEHALSMLLALLHRTREYDDRVRAGEWRDREFFDELNGSTVGIVGYGQVGRSLARILRPFEVRVLAFDPAIGPDLTGVGVESCSDIDEMLPNCNVVSLHIPLLESTRHLFGADQFRLMPQGSVLVNTARGLVIDEAALVEALVDGHLRGAALDVMEVEPARVGSALLNAPNCILSPHISSFGKRTIAQISQRIVAQLNATAIGGLPDGLVSLRTPGADPTASP